MRFKAGHIDNKDPYKMGKDRIFQLLGCLNKASFKNIVNFLYLGNFLEDQATLSKIREMLLTSEREIHHTLNDIPNFDILICFMYFNLGASKLSGKEIENRSQKVNPNLNKLFLRHFPQFVKELKFSTESDDEDYTISKRKKSGGAKLTNKQVKELANDKKNKNLAKLAKNIFVQKNGGEKDYGLHKEDLSNKFDFPTLPNEQIKPAPKPSDEDIYKAYEIQPKGPNWGGDNELYIYNKKKMSKKEKDQNFPTLGAISSKKSSKKSKNVKKNKKKQEEIQENNFPLPGKAPQQPQAAAWGVNLTSGITSRKFSITYRNELYRKS